MSGLHGALRRLAVGVAVLSVALAACGDGHRRGDARGLVNIAINPWVGYEANAAVVGVLLERLGYKVATKALTEERSWEGFETGDVDVIVENWGHADLKQRYIDERRVAVFAGETGNTGIIGWYVPGWMAELTRTSPTGGPSTGTHGSSKPPHPETAASSSPATRRS